VGLKTAWNKIKIALSGEN